MKGAWLVLAVGVAFAQEQPRLVVVDIDLAVELEGTEARLLWVGVLPHETDGRWTRPGATPAVLQAGEPMEVGASWSVLLPMVEGLRYFAVIDTDGDGAPGGGEPVGGPVQVGGAPRASVVIDGYVGRDDGGRTKLSPVRIATPENAPTTDGSALAPELIGTGTDRDLTVALAGSLAFFEQGRFVVVGFAPGTPWVDGLLPEEPAFVWTSGPTPLRWPISLQAPVPDGLDVVLGLDLDGDGDLGEGDLVARPVPAYAGQSSFTLDRTLPKVRPPPPPPHHDFVEQ